MNHLEHFENNGGIVLLDTKQLKAFLHIKGDATLWRYLKENRIPQPKFSVSRSKRLWALDEVEAHLSKNNGNGGEI